MACIASPMIDDIMVMRLAWSARVSWMVSSRMPGRRVICSSNSDVMLSSDFSVDAALDIGPGPLGSGGANVPMSASGDTRTPDVMVGKLGLDTGAGSRVPETVEASHSPAKLCACAAGVPAEPSTVLGPAGIVSDWLNVPVPIAVPVLPPAATATLAATVEVCTPMREGKLPDDIKGTADMAVAKTGATIPGAGGAPLLVALLCNPTSIPPEAGAAPTTPAVASAVAAGDIVSSGME